MWLRDAFAGKQSVSEKGTPGGYAPLDGSGNIPPEQVPPVGAEWGGMTGTLSDQTDLQDALDAKAEAAHTHVKSDITDFAHTHAAPAISDSTAVGRSVLTAADAAAARTAIGAGTSSFNGAYGSLSGVPSTFAPSAHTHAISDVTNLQTSLDGKSATGHNHAGVYEPADAAIQTHVASAHAPSNAQKNSDITKAEIEAKLTGEISSHTHAGGSQAFPVGSVFIAVVSTNPATLLGYGTWAALGAGRVLVGHDPNDTDFDTAKETGGAKTSSAVVNHTHSVNVTDPGHTHLTQRYPTATGGSTGFTIDVSMSGTLADNTLPTKAATTGITASTSNPAGGVASFPIMPPYLVAFFWERTA